MNKKGLLITAFLVMALVAPSLHSVVQAKIIEINTMSGFTEYYGTLGGANFYILIPEVWENPLGNGMLVIICRSAAYYEDPREDFLHYSLAQMLATQGIAVAESNYGETPLLGIKEGLSQTHQLTMYTIENYAVPGKVFLFGTSLGGAVALLLGEKYPDVYSGVLDNSGVKDFSEMYNDAASYSGSDLFLLVWYGMVKADLENICCGTPSEKPNKYAKYSPVYHADITIPVLSVVHINDVIVKPAQTDMYDAALGDSSLHVIVYVTDVTPGAFPVPGATGWYGHFDPATFMTAAANLISLIVWSNALDP